MEAPFGEPPFPEPAKSGERLKRTFQVGDKVNVSQKFFGEITKIDEEAVVIKVQNGMHMAFHLILALSDLQEDGEGNWFIAFPHS